MVTDSMDSQDHLSFKYTISSQWDGKPHDSENSNIHIKLEPVTKEDNSVVGVKLIVSAPFYNSPSNPGGKAGEPFPQLWDYEVVEAFFLSEDENNYLEVELCPHGQHLVLLLGGTRHSVKDKLPLKYEAKIQDNGMWSGAAEIPLKFFPLNVDKFNAYAIHGEGKERRYEALYPVPTGKYQQPDFHRLDYFQPINFKELVHSGGDHCFWDSNTYKDI